jgi:ubiquitin C-terminal hydrolase
MVLHQGKLFSRGHFVACVMDETDTWYRVDDACVYPMKEDAVLASCPYVLFYKRINV